MNNSILYIYFFLISVFTVKALATENSAYAHLNDPEIYRALNWIRDVSNPQHTVEPGVFTREGRVGDTLFIDGEIQTQQAWELEYGEYKGVRRVVLNSHGGHIVGAADLAKVIRQKNLDTVIPANGVCMSACTLVFQAGVRRQAHRSAIFMYHAPRISNMFMQRDHYDICREKGQDYCDQLMDERIKKAPEESKAFFTRYELYDFSPHFFAMYLELPNLPEEEWMKDGNLFRKPDLFFADNPEDQRLIDPNEYDIFLPLKQIETYNVVTEWFDHDPGWRVDRTSGLSGESTSTP